MTTAEALEAAVEAIGYDYSDGEITKTNFLLAWELVDEKYNVTLNGISIYQAINPLEIDRLLMQFCFDHAPFETIV